MQVRDILENSLYLSLKDRNFNALPTDNTTKTAVLSKFLSNYNQILYEITPKKGNMDSVKFDQATIKENSDNGYQYVDLTSQPFYNVYNVYYILYGDSFQYVLKRVSLIDFDNLATVKKTQSYPIIYRDDALLSNRLYFYPKSVQSGYFVINGIIKHDASSIDDILPDDFTPTFITFLTYKIANRLCQNYHRPWSPEHEKTLKELESKVNNDNSLNIISRGNISGINMGFRNLNNIKVF